MSRHSHESSLLQQVLKTSTGSTNANA